MITTDQKVGSSNLFERTRFGQVRGGTGLAGRAGNPPPSRFDSLNDSLAVCGGHQEAGHVIHKLTMDDGYHVAVKVGRGGDGRVPHDLLQVVEVYSALRPQQGGRRVAKVVGTLVP